MKKIYANILLFLAAVIWGCSFVAQSVGANKVGPFTYQMSRTFLGGLVLLPIILISENRKKKLGVRHPMSAKEKKALWLGGLCCGAVLCFAANMQAIGIMHTTVGKAGFITAMYVLIVPFMGMLIGRKIRGMLWICVGLAAVGLYFLCIGEAFQISKGDVYILGCAIGFALHFLVVDHFVKQTDGIRLSCVQFFTVSVISGILMLIFEEPKWSEICAAWLPICYAGILSCGLGLTMQAVVQKHTDPVIASLIVSLESVFAVLAGIVLLKEIPTVKEALGCVLMFAAIILAQLPEKRKS